MNLAFQIAAGLDPNVLGDLLHIHVFGLSSGQGLHKARGGFTQIDGIQTSKEKNAVRLAVEAIGWKDGDAGFSTPSLDREHAPEWKIVESLAVSVNHDYSVIVASRHSETMAIAFVLPAQGISIASNDATRSGNWVMKVLPWFMIETPNRFTPWDPTVPCEAHTLMIESLDCYPKRSGKVTALWTVGWKGNCDEGIDAMVCMLDLRRHTRQDGGWMEPSNPSELVNNLADRDIERFSRSRTQTNAFGARKMIRVRATS